MDIARFSRSTALGLLMLAALPTPGRAADGGLRCDSLPRWEDASSVVMDVRPQGPGDLPAAMTLERDTYEDGIHLISVRDGVRQDMVWMPQRPGELLLASDPTGPGERGDAGMLLTYPLGAARALFHGPCEMIAGRRYPLELHNRDETMTGELEREDDAVRVALRVDQPWQAATFTGRFVFRSPRERLPTTLSLRGWTIFHDRLAPVDGEAARFATLGDFLNSLAAPAAK